MTVIVLTSCPPKLRGDMSKWFVEINTGVYVGTVSARVRDALWDRICENIRTGQATMVFTAAGEQHMDFRVHNTTWIPTDFDGIRLMLHPSVQETGDSVQILKPGFSKAAQYQKARSGRRKSLSGGYVVIDLETTGLKPENDQILEAAALRVSSEGTTDEFSALIAISGQVPPDIENLTGIDDAQIQTEGRPLKEALSELQAFVSDLPIVAHNAAFDVLFLQYACKRCSLPPLRNRTVDTLALARRKLPELPDHKLLTLAEHFGIETGTHHRALDDCKATRLIYEQMVGGSDAD